LPSVATSWRNQRMLSSASAVGCHPLRKVPSLRRCGSTRGPLSAGFRQALTQATHYSTTMHDLLFARASTKRSISDSASRSAPATRPAPSTSRHAPILRTSLPR
jgi:hypothetical protein